jgi:membrane carboxypeptidase/penicillin-binding protein
MRVLLRVCVAGIGVVLLVPISAFAWLYFDSRGLPSPESLAQFAPQSVTTVSDPCLKSAQPFVAIPYDSVGTNMRAALSAAEASEDDPGILNGYYRAFMQEEHSKGSLSYLVQRSMFCQPYPGRTINHQLDSLRMSIQLEKRYSHRELFTIFVNRLYFGEDQYGVEAASQHFFHKDPSQLLIQEAALLAGMARSPTRLSPRSHPDLALERRNQVIDAMFAARAISETEASAARASPLPILVGEGR